MKTRQFIILLCCIVFPGSLRAQSAGIPQDAIPLFNGKDLSNWVFHLKDPGVDPANVFSIHDGIIRIAGDPFGYMRTREPYGDYTLTLEWRWPQEATNSGVFIHTQEPDAIWPACFECQLAAGRAGDFICMSGTDMDERTDKTKIVVANINPSNEKPVGEWNTLKVICQASTITVYINGLLQNKASGTSLSRGSIGLQSEGKAIEFRNIYLARLQTE